MSHLSWFYVGTNAAFAILKLLIVVGTGMVLERVELLNPYSRKFMSQCVFYVCTPCLIFVQIGDGLTRSELVDMWPLVAFPFLMIGSAMGVGYIALLVTCKFRELPVTCRRAYVAAIMFANTGNIPFSIVQSLARDVPPFSTTPGAEERMISQVAVYSAAEEPVGARSPGAGRNQPSQVPQSDPELIQHEPLDLDLGPHESLEAISLESAEQFGLPPPPPQPPRIIEEPPRRGFWQAFKDFWQKPWVKNSVGNPSTLAIILAVLVVLITPVQELLFDAEAQQSEPPLKFVTEGLDLLGDMAIPLGLLILGGSLWQHLSNLKSLPPVLSPWILLLNAFAKLIVMSAIGFGLVIGFETLHVLPSNPELLFVLIIQSGVPAAVNLIVLASLAKDESITLVLNSLMIYHYSLSLITLIILITVAVEYLV